MDTSSINFQRTINRYALGRRLPTTICHTRSNDNLDAIDEIPVPSLETDDGPAWGRGQRFFHQSARTTEGAIIALVGVERYAIDVSPELDRYPGDDFVGPELERLLVNVLVPSSAADFGQRPLPAFHLKTIYELPMPDCNSRNAIWSLSEETVRHTTAPAAFLPVFLAVGKRRFGSGRAQGQLCFSFLYRPVHNWTPHCSALIFACFIGLERLFVK